MTRILLVDDHVIFRDGLKALINDVQGFKVVGEADDGEEALATLEVLKVDMVITDLHMPVLDGIKLTRQVREKYPRMKIVVLTMDADKSYISAVNDMGAHGYITKATNIEQLKNVLQSVNEQTEQFRIAVSNKQITSSIQKEEGKMADLTKRELEILSLIADGLTDKEIAEKVYLSPYTVITHRKNLLSKLNLNNKVELARFAIENGLGKKDLLN